MRGHWFNQPLSVIRPVVQWETGRRRAMSNKREFRVVDKDGFDEVPRRYSTLAKAEAYAAIYNSAAMTAADAPFRVEVREVGPWREVKGETS